MKKGVMTLLLLTGLTQIGAIEANGKITTGQITSNTASPALASNQQSMLIRKTLKGYSSMKRTPYLVELMQLA